MIHRKFFWPSENEPKFELEFPTLLLHVDNLRNHSVTKSKSKTLKYKLFDSNKENSTFLVLFVDPLNKEEGTKENIGEMLRGPHSISIKNGGNCWI